MWVMSAGRLRLGLGVNGPEAGANLFDQAAGRPLPRRSTRRAQWDK